MAGRLRTAFLCGAAHYTGFQRVSSDRPLVLVRLRRGWTSKYVFAVLARVMIGVEMRGGPQEAGPSSANFEMMVELCLTIFAINPMPTPPPPLLEVA